MLENSITEVADHHYGQNHMGNLAAVAPNPAYGDPDSNVAVLQSEPLFLPHNATYCLRVRVQYTVFPPYPPQTVPPEDAEILITQSNLEVVDSRPEGWFVWDPAIMTEVPFSVELRHAQQGNCTVHEDIFRSDNNETPIFSQDFQRHGRQQEGDPITRPGVWNTWAWDGRLSDGSVAERGLYFYRVSASTRCDFVTDGDNNRSAYLHIEHAREQSGDMAFWCACR